MGSWFTSVKCPYAIEYIPLRWTVGHSLWSLFMGWTPYLRLVVNKFWPLLPVLSSNSNELLTYGVTKLKVRASLRATCSKADMQAAIHEAIILWMRTRRLNHVGYSAMRIQSASSTYRSLHFYYKLLALPGFKNITSYWKTIKTIACNWDILHKTESSLLYFPTLFSTLWECRL
jgi:hypothetical protein